jgi:hypothetical protein
MTPVLTRSGRLAPVKRLPASLEAIFGRFRSSGVAKLRKRRDRCGICGHSSPLAGRRASRHNGGPPKLTLTPS